MATTDICMERGNVSSVLLEGTTSWIIFFDDQNVRQFVKSWTCTKTRNGQPGQASVTMVYSEALADFDYMTDVKIFSKNIFSGRYRLVFDGQLHARDVSMSTSGEKNITYTAVDNMFWFTRAPLPILLGPNVNADQLVTFSWLSKGVNIHKINTVLTKGQTAFENLNIKGVIDAIFKVINDSVNIHEDATMADKNSIYNWIRLSDKIRVLSDIDPSLRSSGVVDIAYQGSILENVYAFLYDLFNKLGFEFYEDIDSIIKIKEPYWNEGVLKNNVIVPELITDFNESTNWDNRYSRVLVSGGIDALYQNSIQDEVMLHNMTPAGVFVGAGTDYTTTSDGLFLDTNAMYGTGELAKESQQFVKGDQTPFVYAGSTRGNIVNAAHRAVEWGVPYSHANNGANTSRPSNLDCSGLVYWAYNQAGITVPRRTCANIVRACSASEISVDQLQPGDIGILFNGYNSTRNHTGIYCGTEIVDGKTKHVWIHASSSRGKAVRDRKDSKAFMWNKFYNYSGAAKGGAVGGTIAMPTGDAYKVLSNLTELERRQGVSLYETNQPLIKTGMEAKVGQTPYAYLKKYSSYLYNVLNAGATNASLNMVSAPWFRPGFNVWVDPLGLSRFYYIDSVRHYGDGNGVFTTLGLTYGRSEQEWIRNYKKIDPKTNANPFTLKNNITSKEYFVPDGTTDDKISVVTPSNMGEKRYVKNADDDPYGAYDDQAGTMRYIIRQAQKTCSNGVPTAAYESPYKAFYGQHFVRRDTTYLNRWDSEFNYVEVKAILAAGYKINTDTVNKALALPPTGPLNPTDPELRSVSEIARKAIEYDRDKLFTPAVITERATKTTALVAKAKQQIYGRYDKDFEYRE